MARSSRKKQLLVFTNVRMSVLAIVFVLFCLGAVVHFQNQEIETRDARRINDLKQMQTVLNYHYQLYKTYPLAEAPVCFEDLSAEIRSVVPWLVVLPQDPSHGNSAVQPRQACYNYLSPDGQSYILRAALEKNNFSMVHDNGSSEEWFEVSAPAIGSF